MGMFVANKLVKLMIGRGLVIKDSKILILGVTFKENCPDIRNSKVVDIYDQLVQFGLQVEVFDPHADHQEVWNDYNIKMIDNLSKYAGIILAVAHNEFLSLDLESVKATSETVIFDLKAILDREKVDARL
jgi:UDP-N-acetyl-D-galactosamine dehydrogenase